MTSKIALALVMAAAVLAGCAGPGGPAGQNDIVLEAKEFEYSPGTVEIAAGQRVKLTLKNTGALEHDFTIMEVPVTMHATAPPMDDHEMHMEHEPQLHMAAMMGKSSTMEFTITQPGTYEFYCTVEGHKDAGMHGTLVVK